MFCLRELPPGEHVLRQRNYLSKHCLGSTELACFVLVGVRDHACDNTSLGMLHSEEPKVVI